MNFTIENFEVFLFILVRISAFIVAAPFFSSSNVPRRLKAGLAFFLSIICFQMTTYQPVAYEGTIGFALLLLSEAMVGLTLGYISNICMLILNFAGHMIDVEIGFSMATIFDPMTRIQVSVTGNYYTYFVLLMLLVTNMHYYLIRAIIDSISIIPFGMARFLEGNLAEVMVRFMSDYFAIGFRIILPVFSCILIINVVLGIMVKVAPQMNMFVVGMQMKVLTGLFILFVIVSMIPIVSDFIFKEMRHMVTIVVNVLKSVD